MSVSRYQVNVRVHDLAGALGRIGDASAKK